MEPIYLKFELLKIKTLQMYVVFLNNTLIRVGEIVRLTIFNKKKKRLMIFKIVLIMFLGIQHKQG